MRGYRPAVRDFAGAWPGAQVTGFGSGAGVWVVGPESGNQLSIGGASFGGAYANRGGIEPSNAPSAALGALAQRRHAPHG